MNLINFFKILGLFSISMIFGINHLIGSDKTTIRVSFWGPVKQNAFKDTANAYMKENPNIEIELMNIPGSTYTQKLMAMVASGTAPDVININTPLTLAWMGSWQT